MDFPWITLNALADQRALEELLKRGQGDLKVKFPLPLRWFGQLDALSNFRLQDTFGLSTSGAGEVGRYYSVESITYDLLEGKLDIIAADMQWLLRQYCVAGDEDALATNWSSAGEADRMYCYACNELSGDFADGELGKILVDESLLG